MTTYNQHRKTYLFYFIASFILVVASATPKHKVVSLSVDRILQVVAVAAAIYSYFSYKKLNQRIQDLRYYPDHQERFNHFSAAFRKFWFQLFVNIGIISFGYFITDNIAFLVLTISIFISMVIFLPSRIAVEKLLKIPYNHPLFK